jgi:hypothetical membrane protein
MYTSVDSDRRPAAGLLRNAPPAWAGIVGPLLFTGAFLAQEALRRGEFDPVSEPVSALEAGPNGWLQQVNFVVFGLLTILFAVGLQRAVSPSRRGIAGPALLTVSGIGLLLAAAFPLREDASGNFYDPGGHAVAGIMFFGTSAVGLMVLSLRLTQDRRWRSLAAYTALAGVVALAGFFVMGALVMPDDAPLHDWAGLIQRALIILVVFPCRITLGIRMLRLQKAPSLPSTT